MERDYIENQELLACKEKGDNEFDYKEYCALGARKHSCYQICWTKKSLMIALIISVIANLLFGATYFVFFHGLFGSDISPYAGLTRDFKAPFPWSTGYGTEVTNHTLLNERWEAININPGAVAVSYEWANEHNLPPTQPFPWDPSKGVYFITAFHTLHCLKGLRQIVYDAHHGLPLSRDPGHALHCLDVMRTDAMCNADDFLMSTPPHIYGLDGPRGQARVCKEWDALVDWAAQHNACYQHITDDEEWFAANHEELERYKNCPPNSPYLAKMNEYFASRQSVDRFSRSLF